MRGVKQILLVTGLTAALIIVALATYFMLVHPSFISITLFFVVVPVFLILGLGLFKIAREEVRKSN
ncbi:MAG: hypothetical protein QOD11_124 [Bradyrhizobium sp.]|jgi:hypothetical protein|nr:hypothetical protein [Bradyrhizobium sp.]